MRTAPGPSTAPDVDVVEVRLLEGPNLYFTRPAVKISLRLPGYLALDEPRLLELAAAVGLRRTRGGEAGTASRQHFVVRLVERAVRRLARAAGTVRLGVRVRPGAEPDELVVAVPLSHRERGQAMGHLLGPLLGDLLALVPDGLDRASQVVARHAASLDALPVDDEVRLPAPQVPVIAITGTNGKTSTTRLVAHIGMTAGLRTGWSSTDGVLVQGETVERGDYSGPAGARTVLAAPGVQLAVLETARGGMLLKGLGTPWNDVSVVTNVSADHLGQNGIDTLDQLAEVKAIITRVTREQGWAVLNGDDPRVWAMRTRSPGRPWCFSLDPDSPSLREALEAGGRGITVLDGDVVVLAPGEVPRPLLPLDEVPMTLAGLSRHSTANALAGAAGALGLGIAPEAVVAGLRTFAPDHRHNPGRMNIYTVPAPAGGSVTVVLDMAHNEGGLEALLDVAEGLRPAGSRVLLGLGTGGDRTDEVLVNLGETAGLRADLVHVVHKEHYLRGRTVDDLTQRFREGLRRAGTEPVAVWDDELSGLHGLLAQARPGDVLPLMVHSDQALLHTWLTEHGARPDDPAAIRRKVLAARESTGPAQAQAQGRSSRPRVADGVGRALGLLRSGDHQGARRVLEELLAGMHRP